MRLRIARLEDDDSLHALREEWNDLLERSASRNLFLTWEWVSTWWKVYGANATLHILTARRDDGLLCGIAPLKRTRRHFLRVVDVRRLEFIGFGGDVVPDHLDFICATGLEREVTYAFVNHVLDDPDVDGLELRPFSGESPNISSLSDALQQRSGHLTIAPASICPVLPLPATNDEFLASRSRNYRKKMREYERRCERDHDVRLRRSETHDELQRDMQTLVDLHRKRWSGESRAFRTEQYLAFHRRLSGLALEKGWMRLFTLESSAVPLAHLYCFAYGRRYYYYQAGWDPAYARQRVGLVLMHKVIQEAIKEGATLFDFLRGREPYKYRWSVAELRDMRVRYWKGSTPRLVAAFIGLLDLPPTMLASWKARHKAGDPSGGDA